MDNATYFTSILVGLSSAYLIQKSAPGVPAVIKFFLVPLTVIYVTAKLLALIFPHLNRSAERTSGYLEMKMMNGINNTGYMQLYPPLMAIFVIFVVLLYNRNLG